MSGIRSVPLGRVEISMEKAKEEGIKQRGGKKAAQT
jgi:hypothetical protein